MSPATHAGDRVRTAVLDAAARVLAARPDASMAEIAEAAGIGRATLYRHYEGREALLVDLGAHAMAEATAALDAANLDGVDAREAIARALRVLVRIGARFAVLLREPEHVDHSRMKQAIGARTLELMARGQREGILRADVPAEWLVVAFKGVLDAAFTLTPTTGPEDAAAFATRQFLAGAGPG